VTVVVLDSEALSVLASPRERGVASRRAQAVLDEAHRRGAEVRIPAGVLVEAYKGSRRDAGIDRAVRGKSIVPIDQGVARVAGRLLGRDRLDSCSAVDASVVATAIRLGGGVILTGDPDDLGSLARDHPNVVVQALV
jgi:PIN domain-containing protein